MRALERLFPDFPLPAPGRRVLWRAPSGCGDAFLLAGVARRLETSGRMLVVLTDTAQNARRLREEILWFWPDARAHVFPDWETLPYDHFSPHPDIVSERLSTLWAVWQNECPILLIPVVVAASCLPPPSFLAAHVFSFTRGEKLHAEKLRAQLALAGYLNVAQVSAPGEFAVRGSLIDLFPMGEPLPYRIDLFDEEIESIRVFDVETQRTARQADRVRLLPAREFPLDLAGQTVFRRRYRERFEGDPAKSRVYRDVSSGASSPGIEYFLPLFFDEGATLFDYLPQNAALVFSGNIAASLAAFWRDTRARYAMLEGDPARHGTPLLAPEELFLREEDFFTRVKNWGRAEIEREEAAPESAGAGKTTSPLFPVAIDRQQRDPLAALKKFLADFPGRTLLVAETAGRRETLARMFAEHGLEIPFCEGFSSFWAGDAQRALSVAPLYSGLLLENRLAILSEAELYAGRTRTRGGSGRKKYVLENWLKDLAELKTGDPVVHEQHGVGRYMGLVRMENGKEEVEFLEIHYANEARLFVPVAQLQVVSRYSGTDPERAPLHVLGSGQWEKARRKAAAEARDTAAELLALYALRAARQGHAFAFEPSDMETFAAGFGFEETEDQGAAIEAVLADMRSGKPMDRLVCGDVGFGKTEVALRAAFAAVMDGRQVAVLCPTTLLCEQHFQTFSERFSPWPVRVAELSRFRSAKESEATLTAIAEGTIDIVIGTHKLISHKTRFARLGLVVVDEEHRFGVRQKEALKALRAEVDALTLTATPIPRTLSMSLEGLRDFSVIATAPQKRLSIKTFVSPFSSGIVREAVLRELKRGGQIYFLHNEVATIEAMREKLERLLPEARIVVGHGQMPERELERVMRDFMSQRANLLLCTTIVETGIDNPHANTILIHRAEKFGLAQLHQLRGRVGRSHHQAYAYLLVEEGISKQARQRLDAIQSMEDLGAGFYLAMHDLEIRGAGEVLGDRQSGEMREVGFGVFSDFLNRAVALLKAGKEPSPEHLLSSSGVFLSGEIYLSVPTFLPSAYCPDVRERLSLYKRLSSAECDEEIDVMEEELTDRFGALPEEGRALIFTHRLRLRARPFGVRRLEASAEGVALVFDAEMAAKTLDSSVIIQLLQSNRNVRMKGQDKLFLSRHCPTLETRVAAAQEFLAAIAEGAKGG
ncbi:MAG: transcription-repair coupling factor [Zoogloeaceae bacterium]|nr:transcription-repair coupling factor [Zoogloeaceae bacterium]